MRMRGGAMLRSIRIQRMLSFRDATLELRPLNVLIGPNASGKSNLIEIIALLQAAPRGLRQFINKGGGIADWLWKGGDTAVSLDSDGEVEVVLDHPDDGAPLRYVLKIADGGHKLKILEERLEYESPSPRHDVPYWFFTVKNGYGQIKIIPESIGEQQELKPQLSPDTLTPGESVLHGRKEPTLYPEVSFVGKQSDSARMYREWNMGRESAIRRSQRTDDPSDFLDESFANLALVLNNLELGPEIHTIQDLLGKFYPMYETVNVKIEAGMAQLWIREKGLSYAVPATRLSDGTLRFLSLLAILCHPQPPPPSYASKSQNWGSIPMS